MCYNVLRVRQINLISPENRMILVLRDAPPERVNRHEAKLVKVLQDLSGNGESPGQGSGGRGEKEVGDSGEKVVR